MRRLLDLLAAGLAPAIRGGTSTVTTKFLPGSHPLAVALLGLLSPLVAVPLGALVPGERLSALQWPGVAIVIGSVAASQRPARAAPVPAREVPGRPQ
jgi:drug/metabolite transporter (DMT)-like permease